MKTIDLSALWVVSAKDVEAAVKEGATEVALGARACPGPFVATFFATQAFADDPALVERLCDGRSLVALGEGGVYP